MTGSRAVHAWQRVSVAESRELDLAWRDQFTGQPGISVVPTFTGEPLQRVVPYLKDPPANHLPTEDRRPSGKLKFLGLVEDLRQ